MNDEHIRADEALRESEERFRRTFENAAVGIALTDQDRRFIRVNEKFGEILGYASQELAGMSVRDVTVPEEVTADDENIRQLVQGKISVYSREKRYVRKDGGLVWAQLSASVLQRDAEGKPKILITIIQDISDRKRLETELHLAHERLDLAVRGSKLSIWEFDMPDGQIDDSRTTLINVWESLGYDANEEPNNYPHGLARAVYPDDQLRVRDEIQSFLQGDGVNFQIEYRVCAKDGSIRWHLSRGVALRDPSGKPFRFIGSFVDTTDLKRTEEKLRQSEERFRGTFENAAVGIIHCDLDGRFLRVNQTYCDLVGFTREELLSMFIKDVTHPDDMPATLNKYVPLSRGELATYSETKRYIRKDKSIVWILVTVSLQKDPSGAPLHCIGILRDLTDSRRLEAALRHAKESAERANRAKDEFLANVSHEIRTPMNAILGMTDLALDSTLTENQRQLLKTVKSAANNLLGIINDLLDFSKIEAGKLELDIDHFSLRSATGDIIRAMTIRAQQKGLSLICNIQSNVNDALVGDAGRLRQVLFNLIGNAIKFTEKGQVVVEVAVAPNAAITHPNNLEVQLLFTVRDTGIGISPEKHGTIFRAFEQEDTSTTRKYGGTGLGLTISARLVALMGGTISVESKPGLGSTFTFTAQFLRSPKQMPHASGLMTADDIPSISVATAVVSVAGAPNILVAEDNEFNVTLLKQQLSRRGYRAHIASDGISALALASLDLFDLLLLDVHMPQMDGFQVVRAIREREQATGRHLPIIAFTAHSGQTNRERCLAAGMDDFLSKPVGSETLWAAIDRMVAAYPPTENSDTFLLDSDAILRACESDASKLAAICRAFRTSLPHQMARVQSAMRDRDTPGLRDAAHSLHPTLATFSTIAGNLASKLEDEAVRGELDACTALVVQISYLCSELLELTRELSIDSLHRA